MVVTAPPRKRMETQVSREFESHLLRKSLKALVKINMKQKLPLVISLLYALVIITLYFLSAVIEGGRTCYAANPYWNYGLINLPCYFFDSLFKLLLNPSSLLLMFLPVVYLPNNLFFITALILNSIFVYLMIVWIRRFFSRR